MNQFRPNLQRVFLLSAVIPPLMFLATGEPIAQAAEPESFAQVLDRETRRTFETVDNYVTAHPDAADTQAAYQWLFDTALTHELEELAVPAAKRYLESSAPLPESLGTARRIQGIGLARQGDLPSAFAAFEAEMANVDIRSPDSTIDFAVSLYGAASLAGEHGEARSVLERLSSGFFLNAGVRRFCENRLVRLDLVNQPAPALHVNDLAGNALSLEKFAGKPVLIDFWATNCPPCLDEFPKMKQLYADYHKQGFEIIGVSLDDSAGTVVQFQKQWKLPWPLVVDPDQIRRIRDDFRVRTIPALFLVGPDGKIAQVDLKGRNLRSAVDNILSKTE